MHPQSFMNPVHFQSNSEMLPWSIPPVQPYLNPVHHHDQSFLLPPSPSAYGLFNRNTTMDQQHLRFISDSLVGQVVHHHNQPGSIAPFGLQAELQKMSAQEIMDAKALAASKSHSEAERRRRERINNHLAKLRSLLPNTTKTDKASLLAEVIQHVKELKRQTSLISETSLVPTEIDELTVDNATSDEDGKFLIKASLCCEDRSDLLPDLIKTLKALRLKTLKAEITTLGGRVRNVLFITGDDYYCDDSNNNRDHIDPCTSGDDEDTQMMQQQPQYCISSIQEALKAVMEKSSGDDSASTSVKRQRTNSINILS
ncbi:transcription factor bHLH30 [Solanum tuberosum]|uniref:DNA binding protein n=1 Tax=Solanum tuberosum TaxID=4113 RepID=M0ZJQ7_SOLTU|nr:PREDICTED: transcription factor bHLH30 [Solanum tuberosum]KAH0668537.1 hypothetical protein KY289_023030 [Solanum tuberosum]